MTATTDQVAAPATEPDAPPSRQRAEAAALTELLRPVAGRIRVAQVLGALGAAAGLVPFVALAGLADALLAPGPVDRSAVEAAVWLVIAGLGARAGLTGLALAITHVADVRLQAVLRRRMTAHLGRVPLGWFSERSSGLVRKAAQDDVHDLHQVVAHHPSSGSRPGSCRSPESATWPGWTGVSHCSRWSRCRSTRPPTPG